VFRQLLIFFESENKILISQIVTKAYYLAYANHVIEEVVDQETLDKEISKKEHHFEFQFTTSMEKTCSFK